MTAIDVSDEALLSAKEAYEQSALVHKAALERVQAAIDFQAALEARERELNAECVRLRGDIKESRKDAVDALVSRRPLPSGATDPNPKLSLALHLAAIESMAIWQRPDAARAVLVAELDAATAEAEMLEVELAGRRLCMARAIAPLGHLEGRLELTGEGTASVQRAIAYARERAVDVARRIDVHDAHFARVREASEK